MVIETERLFQETYDKYSRSLYRFCLLQMKNPSDAEDVLQEVFIKRLYSAPTFQTPEHERRWMFRVATNQCRDEFKRKCHMKLPLEDMPAIPSGESSELLEQVAALPEKQRIIIHLYYYEGYSTHEIAAILGIAVSAVKMRLKRAREALRGRLEEK